VQFVEPAAAEEPAGQAVHTSDAPEVPREAQLAGHVHVARPAASATELPGQEAQAAMPTSA
jgi:hypothetical protein